MFDCSRKNVHDKFSALSLALQIFRCTHKGTSAHFKGQMHTRNGGHEKKALFQYKKRLYIRKILYSVPIICPIGSSQTFLFYAFLVSFPSLVADVIIGIEEKKNSWSHEEYLGLFTWFTLLESHSCLLLTGPCWRRAVLDKAEVGWELWLYAGFQVPIVWYMGYPRLPVELFLSLHTVWSPESTGMLSGSHFAPLFLQCIQCDLYLTAAALPTCGGT